MALENIDDINVIEEEDLTKITVTLLESLQIKEASEKVYMFDYFDYKVDMISSVADLLRKILIHDTGTSKVSKLNIINLLDKLNTQKENLEMIKSNITLSDIQQASARLSKKSQSAFELK